ncbi:hypothetical protein J416_04613 [Gracilibacillus halophilus YIM-C55.5]|uniref:Spore coat protein n=2 Tax=Gracilibacillus TaxID=74385 RepID=N4WW04_9BACI|nr:hypothetical protein J416_04613 [Gracilibacillus halophilus YIM-C55.5]
MHPPVQRQFQPYTEEHDQRFFGPIGPLGAGLLGFGLGFLGGELIDGPGPYGPYGPGPYSPYGYGPGPYGPQGPPYGPYYGPGPF